MVSRLFLQLRAPLSALVLIVFLCGNFAVPVAQAKAVYKEIQRSEGDPGDGVLKTDDIDDGVESGIALSPEPAFPSNYSVSLNTFFLVPVLLPGNLPGYGTVMFFPAEWSALKTFFYQTERRGHHAP